MISDVCAALLSNLMIESEYCLNWLNAEYQSLEEYTAAHKREIGKHLKPRKPVDARPFGMWSLVLGFVALFVCNCVAWFVVRR